MQTSHSTKKGTTRPQYQRAKNERQKEAERDKGSAKGKLKQAAKDGDIKVLDWEYIVHFIEEPFRRK